MPQLTIDRVFLHDAEDLTDFIALDAADLTGADAIVGGVGRRAGGRRRATATPGRDGQLDITFDLLTRDEADRLEARAGTVQVLRDPVGRVWWGVFWTTSRREIPGTNLDCTVTIPFQRTTGSPEV